MSHKATYQARHAARRTLSQNKANRHRSNAYSLPFGCAPADIFSDQAIELSYGAKGRNVLVANAQRRRDIHNQIGKPDGVRVNGRNATLVSFNYVSACVRVEGGVISVPYSKLEVNK